MKLVIFLCRQKSPMGFPKSKTLFQTPQNFVIILLQPLATSSIFRAFKFPIFQASVSAYWQAKRQKSAALQKNHPNQRVFMLANVFGDLYAVWLTQVFL